MRQPLLEVVTTTQKVVTLQSRAATTTAPSEATPLSWVEGVFVRVVVLRVAVVCVLMGSHGTVDTTKSMAVTPLLLVDTATTPTAHIPLSTVAGQIGHMGMAQSLLAGTGILRSPRTTVSSLAVTLT